MTEAEKAFILGLTELTKKTGVFIGGCGCCGSPWLSDNKYLAEFNDEYLRDGGYSVYYGTGTSASDLEWKKEGYVTTDTSTDD